MKIKNKIKRVILLCIDSLRYDRLGVDGYPLECSPTLDFLARTGINCQNAYAHGNPTQFSYPSIFTSTLPLDFGGYDHGIKHRPMTLAEVFKMNGFRTIAFSSTCWLDSLYGYDRGFDEFYALYDILSFWSNLSSIYLSYYNSLLQNRAMAYREYKSVLNSLLQESFEFMLAYCDKVKYASIKDQYLRNQTRGKHDYESLRNLLVAEMQSLKEDSDRYLLNNQNWFDVTDLYGFLRKTIRPNGQYSLTGRFFRRFFAKASIKEFISRFVRYNDHVSHVDATHTKDKLLNWLDIHPDDQAFIWAHFMDIHDGNYAPNAFQTIFKYGELLRNKIYLGKQYYGNIAYDFSVKYCDTIVKEIIDFLELNSLLEETLLVIFGDHGSAAGAPFRGINGVGQFYDEFVRVPILFWNPGIERKTIDHLSGLIDLGPTLLDLLEFPSVPEFKGVSMCSGDLSSRSNIVLEHAGRGPCDLTRKPIQLCIRSECYKYICQEDISKRYSGRVCKDELYDLANDPSERVNLSGNPLYERVLQNLKKMAVDRYSEIREHI